MSEGRNCKLNSPLPLRERPARSAPGEGSRDSAQETPFVSDRGYLTVPFIAE